MASAKSILLLHDQFIWRYCLLAFPLALLPSIGLYTLAMIVVDALGLDHAAFSAPDRTISFWELFGGLVFAPIVETLLLSLLLTVLSVASAHRNFVAATAAILCGLAHGTYGLLWFFGTAWSFFVFSYGFLAWRKVSYLHAFVAAAAPHALLNATVFGFLALYGNDA
jgi:hypothetical protein